MQRIAPVLHRSVIFALSLLVPLTAESAPELAVLPRYEAGERYRLSLSVTTHTEAAAGRGERGFEEKVRVDYAADVLVLEVDAQGLPLRERHEKVELWFERPEETGSLFDSDVRYEVRRDDSDIRIFVADERVDRKVEKVLTGRARRVGALLLVRARAADAGIPGGQTRLDALAALAPRARRAGRADDGTSRERSESHSSRSASRRPRSA